MTTPTPPATKTAVLKTKASEHEMKLCNIMLAALIEADTEFTEDEIKRAAGLLVGTILVTMFASEAQHIN